MTRPRWGALVARASAALPLVAACSAPPAPPPAAPPAPTASEAAPPAAPDLPLPPSTPDPEGASAGLGPAAFAHKLEAEAYRNYQRGIRFGGGLFVLVGSEIGVDVGDPECSIPGLKRPDCTGFRIAPWVNKTTQESWPQIAGAAVKDWGPWVNVSRSWQNLSPGKRGVYAARWKYGEERMTLEFIDEQGKISEIFTDEGLTDALVIETAAGLRVIGPNAERRLVFASVRGGKVVDPRPLDIGDIVAYEDVVSDHARDALLKNKLAAYGPWRALLLPPEKVGAEPAIGLVWVDVVPPRKINRARNQCARPSVDEFTKRTSELSGYGSSNDCSGGGRLLSSKWARKRLHVTRLTVEGKRLSDHTLPLPGDYNGATQPLDLRLEGAKLLIDDRSFDLETKRFDKGKAAPAEIRLEGPSRLAVASAAFDAASGEGVVLFRKTNASWYPNSETRPTPFMSQRFDALGKPVGGVVEVPERPFNSALGPTLVRVAGRWIQRVSPLNHEGSFEILRTGGGPDAWVKARFAQPPQKACDRSVYCEGLRFLGLVASADGERASVFSYRRPDSVTEETLSFAEGEGESSSQVSPWKGYEPYEEAISPPKKDLYRVDYALHGRPLFAGGRLLTTPEGKPIALRLTPTSRQLQLERGEGWARAPGWPEQGEGAFSLHEVWGDLVLVVVAQGRATATWLRRGKSVELAAEVAASIDPDSPPTLPTGEGGPVLPGSRWALPASPGPALPLPPELVALRQLCPVTLPTGPRRAVLTCAEPASTGMPSAVLTLRPLRY